MVLDYLVTGTGRCGTKYCQQLLCSLGIGCSHEAVFHTKTVNNIYPIIGNETWQWKDGYVAESSYMAAPFLTHNCLKNTKIIYLIRDPIKVIQSFVGLNFFSGKVGFHTPYEDFIYKYLPLLKYVEKNSISRAICYYKWWNDMIMEGIKDKEHMVFVTGCHNPQRILKFLKIDKENYFSDEKCNSRQKIVTAEKKEIFNNKFFKLIKNYQLSFV